MRLLRIPSSESVLLGGWCELVRQKGSLTEESDLYLEVIRRMRNRLNDDNRTFGSTNYTSSRTSAFAYLLLTRKALYVFSAKPAAVHQLARSRVSSATMLLDGSRSANEEDVARGELFGQGEILTLWEHSSGVRYGSGGITGPVVGGSNRNRNNSHPIPGVIPVLSNALESNLPLPICVWQDPALARRCGCCNFIFKIFYKWVSRIFDSYSKLQPIGILFEDRETSLQWLRMMQFQATGGQVDRIIVNSNGREDHNNESFNRLMINDDDNTTISLHSSATASSSYQGRSSSSNVFSHQLDVNTKEEKLLEESAFPPFDTGDDYDSLLKYSVVKLRRLGISLTTYQRAIALSSMKYYFRYYLPRGCPAA